MSLRPKLLSTTLYQMWQIVDLAKKGRPEALHQIMDTQISKVAKERSKATAGLDTEETRTMVLSLLYSSGKSLREEAEGLIIVLKQLETINNTNSPAERIIVQAYRSGELKEMVRYGAMLDFLMATVLSEKEMEKYISMQDYLIRGRNEVWMEKIPEMIAEQPTFIAVGARHLPTETGLIEMLRKKGYTVTPVN